MNTLLFPPVIGREVEIRPVFLLVGDDQKAKHVSPHMSEEYKGAFRSAFGVPGRAAFARSGGKIASDERDMEYGTPECADPWTLALYDRAYDEMVYKAVTSHALALATKVGTRVLAMYGRHVVNRRGASWGVHDNVSVPQAFLGENASTDVSKAILWWQAASVPLSGAGKFSRAPSFSQKNSTLRSAMGYGFNSSGFRVDRHHGARLEWRASDRELLPAATIHRVGGVALLTAMVQTPLLEQLQPPEEFKFLGYSKRHNRLAVDKVGGLIPTDNMRRSAEAIYRLGSLAELQLGNYMAVPEPYMQIAQSITTFAEKFSQILEGTADVDELVTTVDWAAKIVELRQKMGTQPLELGSDAAAKIDERYGTTYVLASPDGQVTISHGNGVQRRDAPDVLYPFNQDSIQAAILNAPPNTRAADRVRILMDARIDPCSVDWHQYLDTSGRTQPFRTHYIY